MDNKNIVVDPHEEVRKLQDLVRKLELQNQQLRSKQNLVTRQRNAKEANPVSSMSVSDSKVGAEKGCLTNSINCSMEDDDLIDVSLLDLSNEDSW